MVHNGLAFANEVQFRSKSMVCYQSVHRLGTGLGNGTSAAVAEFRMSERFKANAAKLRNRKKYTGEITAGAKKRLTKAISLLIQSSPEKWIYNQVTKKNEHHKISFITLTLPNIEATKDAKSMHKNMLQPMLRILRNKYKMKSYVWKCELQKNESIHYHITTELFIPWEQLRQHWNALMNSQGLLEAFKEQYGHDNPNSVDIHSVKKVNDLEAYLVKYVSKEYQNGIALAGKVWDCSKNLKEAKYYTSTLTAELHEQILKEIDLGWLQPIYRDRCVILRSRTTDYYQSFSQDLVNSYYSHLTSISSWQKSTKRTSTRPLTESATASSFSSQPERSARITRGSKYSKRSKPTSTQLIITSFGTSYWKN